jgi:phosphopantetheinyl transferase (holo-ACP synthase)
MITPRVQNIKHKFLHVDELVFVHSHSIDQQIPLLTLLWSAKEAMFKWWGEGDVDFSEVTATEAFAFQDAGCDPNYFFEE